MERLGSPQYDENQYQRIKDCGATGLVEGWNRWIADNRDKPILLEGADFSNLKLDNIDLQGAFLRNAQFDETTLMGATFTNADLRRAHFRGAWLAGACFEGTTLRLANLSDAKLRGANLKKANLADADLTRALVTEVSLKGASLHSAKLQGANFQKSVVDGETLLWYCEIDDSTLFTGVGLEAARIDPGLLEILKYNVRKYRWEEWYKTHTIAKHFAIPFWYCSDYGSSTKRLVMTFLMVSLAFAVLYLLLDSFCTVGPIRWLTSYQDDAELVQSLPFPTIILRSLYFSVVTMTTLGFGDLHANPVSYLGHILLTIQVCIGYVILGGLITRLSILFTAGGPQEPLRQDECHKSEMEKIEDATEQLRRSVGGLRTLIPPSANKNEVKGEED